MCFNAVFISSTSFFISLHPGVPFHCFIIYIHICIVFSVSIHPQRNSLNPLCVSKICLVICFTIYSQCAVFIQLQLFAVFKRKLVKHVKTELVSLRCKKLYFIREQQTTGCSLQFDKRFIQNVFPNEEASIILTAS